MPVPTNQNTASLNQLYGCNGSKGFTLLELLVVVAIIGTLAAIAIPAYNGYIGKAKLTVAISTLDTIRKNFESFHIDYQEYPTKDIDWDTGMDGATPSREVFKTMLLDQIDDDLTIVLYNTIGTSSYELTARAKDKNQTLLTLTPAEISKAP